MNDQLNKFFSTYRVNMSIISTEPKISLKQGDIWLVSRYEAIVKFMHNR